MMVQMASGPASAAPIPWGRVVSAARLALSGAGAALAIFHAWIFARQAAQGDLADPAVALRWIIAGGLLVALTLLWRRGESLAGRQAVAVWALAALLHGPAITGRLGALDRPALPEAITSALQLVAGVAGLGLALLASLARRRQALALAFSRASRSAVCRRVWDQPARSSRAPRPPPSA
jgi:hypothetical protein